MASCAITIGGTSGSVLIRYTLGSVKNTITAAFGSEVFISSTATAVTYTTLSGDATATSGCVSITELEETCYEFKWESLKPGCDRGDLINAVMTGVTAIAVSPISISSYYKDVADVIDSANNAAILPVAGKFTVGTNGISKNYLRVKIYGSETYIALRVYNPDSTFLTYVVGTPVSCTIPGDYTVTNSCPSPEILIEP